MEEFFAEALISEARSLCIGTITREEAANAGGVAAQGGEGIYLLSVDLRDRTAPPEVLARLMSEEAAAKLAKLLGAKGSGF